MLRNRNLVCFRALSLGLLIAGASACSAEEASSDIPLDGLDDLGVAGSELGVALPSCSTAGSSGFGAGQVLTLSLTGGPSTIMLSAVAGKITVNGWKCVNSSGAALTTTGTSTTAVKKIVINGDPTVGEKVLLDMLPGSFGSTIFSGVSGTGLVIDLGAGGGDTFLFRGTAGADKIVMGDSAGGDTYLDLTGDKKADVQVKGAEAFSITLLGGNDTFSAAGGAVSAASLATGVTSLVPMTTGITVFGGDGNDTIQGGNGDDTLNGGNNDDTFTTSTGTAADGNDVYIGGPGIDTMDYSGRTVPITADIGPQHATVTGSVDLSTLTYPSGLDTLDIQFKVDGGSTVTCTFATPADENAVVSQINTAAGATVASLDASKQLVLSGLVVGRASTFQITGGTAVATLGHATGTTTALSANDGQSGETDDIEYTVENLVGGSGDDTLTGSSAVNTINGGNGNDTIDGVANITCPATGDSLIGGAGNDIFLMGTAANCGVVVSGGAGSDIVDYSQRTADLTITLDGLANDGDPTANSGAGEKGNISKLDVEIVLGGSGDDTITGSANDDQLHGGPGNDTLNGGAGNDTLIGGPGNDHLNGDAGDDIILESGNDNLYSPAIACGTGDDVINGGLDSDKVDYGTRTADLTITLCVNAAVTGAPTGTPGPECSDADGDPLLTEADNVINVEWLVGGDGDDTITASTASVTIEGGAGNDTITGGAGDDFLYGDGGNDTLTGGAGDDYLEGGAGDDAMDGDTGDGDICVSDAADVTAPNPTLNCEL